MLKDISLEDWGASSRCSLIVFGAVGLMNAIKDCAKTTDAGF